MITWASSTEGAARRGAPDEWLAPDKLEHYLFFGLVAGWVAALCMARGVPLALAVLAGAVFSTLLGITVEILEAQRFAAWEARGKPRPWPYLCDLPSYRDLAWNSAGIATTAAVLLMAA